MFASLKNGDLATCYSHLSGLYTGKDEVRHALTTYTVAMRQNLAAGNPIFTGIRQREEELELTTGAGDTTVVEAAPAAPAPEEYDNDYYDEELMTPRVRAPPPRIPATSCDDPNYKIERDNAVLAEILAKELAFLNRTIQMISLVASRYHEEQEDAVWDYSSRGGGGDIETADGHADADDNVGSNGSNGIEGYYDNDDDDTPSAAAAPLTRSQSHSFGEENIRSSDYNDPRPKNQLANTLLVGSGQLQQHFLSLCVLAGTDIILVNAMTTADRPITESSITKQQRALVLVVSSIYTEFSYYDANNRAPVVRVFQTLRDLSSATWGIMSMLAFSNLFRLTHGTDFETVPINPDDAIFSNQGRPFRPRMGMPAASMPEALRMRCEVAMTAADE
jgi:hypothetical protein